jgi:hypothetical protein
MFQHLKPDYQQSVVQKWGKVLDSGDSIQTDTTRVATALVLENTQREFDRLTEAYNGTAGTAFSSWGGQGAQAGTNLSPNGGGALGTAFNYGPNDSRIPNIVIPTIRRIFPELVAHDLVGVQPMAGPVGFAFALRFQYGVNDQGIEGSTRRQGTEMGYNTIDSTFTGASGMVELDETANYARGGTSDLPGVGATTQTNAYWQAFAGASNPLANGLGAPLSTSEWQQIGEDMPMSQFRMEKGVVDAKSRKLAALWSPELQEDMANMHGLNVDSEMVNVMSYEIKAEIDRQLLGEMVKSAIVGGTNHLSEWSPVSADGRNQLERIGTIYTQVLVKSQQIAIQTRRGHATFAVASPTVVALLERLGDFMLDTAPVKVSGASVGIAKVGVMRNGGITLYRDTFAGGDYVLLGYKGPTAYDSGIIYCPYIPLQLQRAVGPNDFSQRTGIRTRYGVLSNMFGSANYYHMMRITGLQNAALAADGGRIFIT